MLLLLALLLWFGFASTVAVAWFYASLHKPPGTRHRLFEWSWVSEGEGDGWRTAEWIATGKSVTIAERRSWDSGYDPLGDPRVERDQPARIEDSAGWPWLSLRCVWTVPYDPPYALPEELVRGGISIAPLGWSWLTEPLPQTSEVRFGHSIGKVRLRDVESRRALPLLPVWSGMVASTALWSGLGAAVIVITALPGALRRGWRRRRGRCVRCGYVVQRSLSANCPECGWSTGARRSLISPARLCTIGAMALAATMVCAALAWTGVSSFEGPQAIHAAARFNDVDRLRRLLEDGVAADAPSPGWPVLPLCATDGSTPLMWAAAHGHLEVMELLIAAGADVNHQSTWNSPLRAAARHGQADALALLLEAGAQPGPQGGIGAKGNMR